MLDYSEKYNKKVQVFKVPQNKKKKKSSWTGQEL